MSTVYFTAFQLIELISFQMSSTPPARCISNIDNIVSLQAQANARHKVMGVLDIYGFEIFEVRQMADQACSPSSDKPQGQSLTNQTFYYS